MNQNEDFYSKYKKLRNKIHQTQLDDSLYVLWSYNAHLNGREIDFKARGIEVSNEFLLAKNGHKRTFLAEWDLRMLVKEVIINSPKNVYKPKTFRTLSYFANTVNEIKENLDSYLYEKFIHPLGEDGIYLHINRIAHLQFQFQTKIANQRVIARYFKIYNKPPTKSLLEQKIGMSLEKFYLVSLVLYGYFLEKIQAIMPIQNKIPELEAEHFEKALKFLSTDFESLKEAYIKNQKYDESFFYQIHIGEIFPLIKMNYMGADSLICVDSLSLFWRCTDGLYYELHKDEEFRKELGKSFELYVEDVLKKALSNKYTLIGEFEYGSSHNKALTTDWIILSTKEVLFVECKTKRLTRNSKTTIKTSEHLNNDIDQMAKFVVQTYKRIDDFKNNKFDLPTQETIESIFPIIVTMEEWYIFGFIKRKIHEAIIKKMNEANLPISYLEQMPYTICSVGTFETLAQTLNYVDFKSIISSITKDEMDYEFKTILLNKFQEEIKKTKPLFEEDFYNLIPKRHIRE